MANPTVSQSTQPTQPTQPTTGPVVEIKYDNAELTGSVNGTLDQDRIKRLMTNMEVREEVNVVKSSEIAKPTNDTPTINGPETNQSSFSLNNLYPNMNKAPTTTLPVVTPLEMITEDKPAIINEPKSPRKDMVIVQNEGDIDERVTKSSLKVL